MERIGSVDNYSTMPLLITSGLMPNKPTAYFEIEKKEL